MTKTTVTARFANTEEATRTAKRIREAIPSAFLSLRYVGQEAEESFFLNETPYTPHAYSLSGAPLFGAYPQPFLPAADNAVLPPAEVSEECAVGAVVEERYAERVRQLFYNGGGYDVKAKRTE